MFFFFISFAFIMRVFSDYSMKRFFERCKITAEVSPDYGPYRHEKDSPAIQTAVKAAEKLGLPVNLEESGGGSDANHFNTYGVPTVVLSVGMEKAHTKDEYIEIKDLYDSARWALEIVKTVAEK